MKEVLDDARQPSVDISAEQMHRLRRIMQPPPGDVGVLGRQFGLVERQIAGPERAHTVQLLQEQRRKDIAGDRDAEQQDGRKQRAQGGRWGEGAHGQQAVGRPGLDGGQDHDVEDRGGEQKRGADPKLTTEQRAASLQKVLDLQADIEKANSKAATAAVVLGVQQTSALDGISRAYAEAKLAAEDYLATLVRTQRRELELFSASNRTRQDEQGRNQISDKYRQDRERIQNDRALTAIQQGGTLTSDQAKQFDDLLSLNREFEAQALSSYADYVERRKKLEGDWQQGAGRAFRNYLDDAQDVASQTEALFSNAFSGLENVITVSNGRIKVSFSGLIDSVIQDLARLALKQALVAPLKVAAAAIGIPGFANGGEAQWKHFLGGVYHSVGDDLSQPINWQAGAKYARLNYLISRDLADADERPRWYQGDYFGDLYAPKAPKVARPR